MLPCSPQLALVTEARGLRAKLVQTSEVVDALEDILARLKNMAYEVRVCVCVCVCVHVQDVCMCIYVLTYVEFT